MAAGAWLPELLRAVVARLLGGSERVRAVGVDSIRGGGLAVEEQRKDDDKRDEHRQSAGEETDDAQRQGRKPSPLSPGTRDDHRAHRRRKNQSLADRKTAVSVVVVRDVAERPKRYGAERKHRQAKNNGHHGTGPALARCVHLVTVIVEDSSRLAQMGLAAHEA